MQGAIALGQTALTAYQSTNDRANEAIVREKLTIAYQQIGQFGEAIDYPLNVKLSKIHAFCTI